MASYVRFQSVDELPLVLTVAEAATVLGVSRSSVYELIHQWRATSGVEGLAACRLGRSLRVPSTAVVALLEVGDRGAA